VRIIGWPSTAPSLVCFDETPYFWPATPVG
jgi:hypothetical protein